MSIVATIAEHVGAKDWSWHSEFVEPNTIEVSYLESRQTEIAKYARSLSKLGRKGLFMVEMPSTVTQDFDSIYPNNDGGEGPEFAVLRQDLCYPEFFAEESGFTAEEVNEICQCVAEGCADDEMWLLLSSAMPGTRRYCLMRYYVGLSTEAMELQMALFIDDNEQDQGMAPCTNYDTVNPLKPAKFFRGNCLN